MLTPPDLAVRVYHVLEKCIILIRFYLLSIVMLRVYPVRHYINHTARRSGEHRCHVRIHVHSCHTTITIPFVRLHRCLTRLNSISGVTGAQSDSIHKCPISSLAYTDANPTAPFPFIEYLSIRRLA